ncbi:ATP-dependent nuclease [Microbacterium sp. CFBP 8794]|uniref:ATP-dependent nuclease n=1 Tax=Microbacterium sp. CFBP 8794 TaxID=2775269 RepID=UPI0017846F45|nr:ATP-dependent endonuclease [Microbacterium sp. CFBP 8794]MBD8479282.1 AAA family ATPase [Microbacterium sp. CFBP 8794]
MKATRVHIKNFRLLEDAEIALDDAATMIVGRNNSGKTSVVEIFRKLTRADRTPFGFDDLSLSTHVRFDTALVAYDEMIAAEKAEDLATADAARERVADLPTIELTLSVKYEVDDAISALAPFIMDLDPDRSDATFVSRLRVNNPEVMFKEYREQNARKPIELHRFLRNRFKDLTTTSIEAVDAQDPTNRRIISDTELSRLISIKFIYAQNQIDDLSSDASRGLSKGFENFFRSNQTDNSVAEAIDDLLVEAGIDLDRQYQELFKSIYSDLQLFGVGSMPGLPVLSVVSQLEGVRLLADNARLYYSDAGQTKQLPEAHNGLGYSKLIFTILQFISFYEELKRSTPEPPIQLIFVEEPEAHLHPQMQNVFVRSIDSFISSKPDWNAQVVITTHSSHVVAESGFECIRYFDNSVTPMQVRDLSTFQLKEVKKEGGPETLRFLRQHMVLNRCDMFFADQIVLIEGAVERLLLPTMIQSVASNLGRKYLSIIEVGGAYAHLFRSIIEFLNIQTLIITDIDSVDPSDKRKATPVGPGRVTSNPTLSKWLPAKSSIDDLLVVDAASKTSGRVRVAYQIPENEADRTGRSFEEAFILANTELLAGAQLTGTERAFQKPDGTRKSADEISQDSWNVADRIGKKTDFAFDIALLEDWRTPLYIKEGLEWLNQEL